MTWTRLDDGFPSHPKVMGLTDGGFRALVTGLCYSNQHLTDGFVPNGVVKTRYAVELCAKHIWALDTRGGYAIHDFLEYNPSKTEVVAERDARKEAGRRGGRAKALANAKALAKAEVLASANHLLTEDSYPVPSRPVPTQPDHIEQPEVPLLAAAPRERDPIWDVFVECYGQPTDSARGQWNSAAKVLRDYPAEADEIRAMIVALEGTASNWAVITPSALAKHFGQRSVLEGQLRRKSHGARSTQLADELRAEGL